MALDVGELVAVGTGPLAGAAVAGRVEAAGNGGGSVSGAGVCDVGVCDTTSIGVGAGAVSTSDAAAACVAGWSASAGGIEVQLVAMTAAMREREMSLQGFLVRAIAGSSGVIDTQHRRTIRLPQYDHTQSSTYFVHRAPNIVPASAVAAATQNRT